MGIRFGNLLTPLASTVGRQRDLKKQIFFSPCESRMWRKKESLGWVDISVFSEHILDYRSERKGNVLSSDGESDG